jgi:autotransporter-associated beta strand protein
VNSNDVQTLVLVSGSLGEVFSFDPATGAFRVVSETALQQSAQTSYTFVVRTTDNGSPARSGTANVILNLVAPDAITATGLQQEIWYNTGSGTTVSALTAIPRYPKRPDALRPLTQFDGGQDLADNYGSRIRGLLKPGAGTYYFYVSSDDNSSLKMSTTSNPSNAVQIASVTSSTDPKQWDRFSTQRSAARSLVAGAKYYLEVLQKEGGGGDHVSVGWSGTGLSGTNVIAGSFLEPVDLNYAPVMTGRILQLPTSTTNGTTLTTMSAADSPLDTITFKLLSGNTENLFAIDPDSGVITLTNASALNNYADDVLTLTVLAQDSGYGGLYPLKTAQATVSIQVIDASPSFTWNGLGSADSWSDSFNWTTGLPQPEDRLIFSGTARQTNSNDLLLRAGRVTLLNGGFRLSGNPLVLLNGISTAGDNTWAIDSKLNRAQSFIANSGILSLEGNVDTDGNTLTIQVGEAVRARGIISGLGGLVKTGPGTLLLSAANTFSGGFQVLEGAVTLENTAAISHCPELQLHEGTLLDASVLPEPLQLQPEQTLTGKGSIAGSVKVLGTLQPGDPTGLLKIDGEVQLLGRTVLRISKQSSASALLQATGLLTLGGTLTVTNLGGTLAAGDVFKVLDAPNFQGSFTSVELPTLAESLQWDSAALLKDGTLRVTLRQPQFYPVTASNGRMLIQVDTWTGLTYELQSSEKLGPDAQWSVISTTPGANGPMSVLLPMDPAKASLYYRFRVY